MGRSGASRQRIPKRSLGTTEVFAASPLYGAALAARANAFIRMRRDFFTGIWRESAPDG